tara:strand:+ start:1118 stop:1795 length:678 start_codon:yes stop_codon:yes gene_type:complete
MDLLQNLENYILDLLLLGDIDPIFEERLNSYQLINSYNNSYFNDDYITIKYLIETINEKPLINLRKSKSNKLLFQVSNLLETNGFLDKSLITILEETDGPKIHQYFFNKIIIDNKLDELKLVPFFEKELDGYPDKILVANHFDLIKDINNLISYLSIYCFDSKELKIINIRNKAIDYIYFFELVIFQINILKFTKDLYASELINLINIRERIINAIEYNIPLKII